MAEETKKMIIAAAILLPTLVSTIFYIENRGLKVAIANIDAGFIEFLNKNAGKGKISDLMIKEGQLGIMRLKDKTIVCGSVDTKF